MAESKTVCFSCHTEHAFFERIGRKDDCDSCGADLHVCLNCQHHDVSSYNECRETSADRIVEKDRSNFCDFFTARSGALTGDDSKDQIMSAAEALFKKG